MRKVLVSSCILPILLGSVCGAVVRQVPADYPSIQQAIDDCNDGDTVLVAPGVYYETINFGGRDITVTSKDPNDPRIVGYTIINADGDGTVVTFENDESPRAVLTGFTITGGVGTLAEWSSEYQKQFYGAGIYCSWGSPTITHNVIANNHGPYVNQQVGDRWQYVFSSGGGIYCQGYATITHNRICNNSAFEGGGVYAGTATVANNFIYGNSAYYGGGVFMYYGSLVNNTIVNNDCRLEPQWGNGGNVYASLGDYGNLIVVNNIICGAASGGGLFCPTSPRGDPIRFNDVWNNLPGNYGLEDPRTYDVTYSESADWAGRFGNISVDPIFLDLWNNNFHLQSASPCISAGDPNLLPEQGTTDIDGEPRVFALRVDIGADESIGYVKPLAGAGPDQHLLTPAPVTLDASGSYFADPCGLRTYQWSQTKGPAVELSDAAAEKPTFTPAAEGWYVFELVVADDQYTSGPDRVLVVVGNQPPVADAGRDQLWPVPGVVLLDGSRSYDADPPDTLTYTWTQIEGPNVVLRQPNSVAPRFECGEPGTYVFQLVVHDGFVASAPDTVKLETSALTLKVQDSTLADYDQGYFGYPDAAGTLVVYAGGESSNHQSWVIKCLDTKTGRIDDFEGSGIDTMPRIDGNHLVWSGSGSGSSLVCTSLLLGDLITRDIQFLRVPIGAESYGYPAISGNKVVWAYHHDIDLRSSAGYQEAPYDICGADITNPAKPVFFTVAERVGQRAPYPYNVSYNNDHDDVADLCGDLVVWEGNGDIFGADLSDLNHIKVFPICTAPQRQHDPSISGHLVVWTDERDDRGDIYGADISDPNNVREFAVWVGPGWQLQPDIDGSLIVFLDGDDYFGDIRLCCLSRDYGVVDIPWLRGEYGYVYGSGPHLNGSTLVWQESSRIRSLSLDFAYNVANGPVQNVTTGRRYDYIQHALDAAAAGDEIVVPPGIYPEKLRFKGKSVTLRSTDPQDPLVRAVTIIAGSGQQAMFAEGETADCVLTGFTLTGGSYGVLCSGAAPTISLCMIANQACAGVKLWNASSPTFRGCEVTGNGLGVEMWAHRDKRIVLTNSGTFRNCLIAGNRGTGVYSGEPTLENCTIADNLGYGVNAILAEIMNSILYFNNQGAGSLKLEKAQSPITYSDVQGGWAGVGNIDADPLFVARGDQLNAGDYHLQSQGWTWDPSRQRWRWYEVTSPCIDTGDPDTPLGDEPRCEQDSSLWERAGVNQRINMGAYGGTAEASLAPR